jgi:hypothetical protein
MVLFEKGNALLAAGKNIAGLMRNRLVMHNLSIQLKKQVDMLVLIEYCSIAKDLRYYEMLENSNPCYNIMYLPTTPAIRLKLLRIIHETSSSLANKITTDTPTLLEMATPYSAPPFLKWGDQKSNEVFRKSGYMLAKSWWLKNTSLANGIISAFARFFKTCRPKVIIVFDDTKLFGSLAAKVARTHHIPTVLISHAVPTPFFFPLICDFQTTWSPYWADFLSSHHLDKKRIWVTGDIGAEAPPELGKKDEVLKKALGLSGKNVIGYFATAAERDHAGLLATVAISDKIPNSVVLVRPHPRNIEYSKCIQDLVKPTSALYVPESRLNFHQFCSVVDIVLTFESSALANGVWQGNYGIQVLLYKRRKPEVDYQKSLGLQVANDENQLEAIFHLVFDDKGKEAMFKKIDFARKKMLSNYGEGAANQVFQHLDKIFELS